jgi:6-phosphogluconate dehydrogenase
MALALEGGGAANLMFAPRFAEMLTGTHGSLRGVVAQAALSGIPTPALAAALGYFDMMRTRRSTANLLQAQRDFFGAHGFERIDRPGAFHGPWGSHAPQPASANGNRRH